MGHLINGKEEVYRALAARLSRFPVGAVVNEHLMDILKLLYTETEAALGSKLPLRPRPLAELARLTGMGEKELAGILDGMAGRGLVIDIPRKETVYYLLAPMVVGFFEYTFMRAGQANTRELAQLFERYFKEDGVAEEVFGSSTKMFKTLLHERFMPALVESEVLSYEKASEIIRASGGGSLSLCACRHKASHLGKPCRYPMEDICTSLGRGAEWLVRRGFGRAATVDDLLRNLDRSFELGLVLIGDNVISEPAYICHCCGCCCGVLRTISKFNVMSVEPSNFLPAVAPGECAGCGTCAERCHIAAIALDDSGEPAVDEAVCIGCGVCAAACPGGAMRMERKAALHTPPQNKMEQMARIAVERNRLA
jgi:Pyruvate/2-oxoacid:ferredoxin oxidoreductase delta subunit